MRAGTNPYKRLPGRARKLFGLFSNARQQLWLGPDHLLVAEVKAYTERYKRYYLKDIQALTMCPTNAGRIVNAVLLGFSGLFLIPVLLLFPNRHLPSLEGLALPVMILLAGISALFLLFLFGNVLLGPTCICHLHTAVQAERLSALGRARTAARTLNLLKWSIESAQGRIQPEDVQDFVAPRWEDWPPGSPDSAQEPNREG